MHALPRLSRSPRWSSRWLFPLAVVFLCGAFVTGCPEPSDTPEDTVVYYDSDPCEVPASGGLPCMEPGAFCRGHILVSCGLDAEGCLVETGVDCRTEATDVCVAEPEPRCVDFDPCLQLPDACDTASAACEGDELVVCARNADGCLVETRTDCAGGTTDYCDAGTQPRCVADNPCEGISDCSQVGRVCEGDELVLCGIDLNGCLVESRVDCLVGDTNACAPGDLATCAIDPCRHPDGSARGQACTPGSATCSQDVLTTCTPDAFGCAFEGVLDCVAASGTGCDASGDPQLCVGGAQCPAPCQEGARCEGDELVVCAPDGFGCLVESRHDCTTVGSGYCDVSGGPVCRVDDGSRCEGKVLCATDAPAITCATDPGDERLVSCSYDDVGCLIEQVTDCAANAQVCAVDIFGVAQCADSCLPHPSCAALSPGERWCDGDVLQSCEDVDSDGCLDLVSAPCVGGWCDATGTPGCVVPGSGDSCLDPLLLQGPRLTVTGASFAADFRDGVELTDASCSGTAGALDLVFRVPVISGETVAARARGLLDGQIHVLDACSESAVCQSTTAAGTDGVTVSAVVDGDLFVVVEGGGSGPYVIELSKPVCGDGVVDFPESCEDGNTTDGDGCTACAVDFGYGCDTSASPNTCSTLVDLGTYAAGDPIADVLQGPIAGGEELWFTITFSEQVRLYATASAKPAGDVDLALLDATGSAVATSAMPGDEALDGLVLAPGVYAIALSTRFGAGTIDALQLRLSTSAVGCGDGIIDVGEACDDGNTVNGDGCTSTCALQGASTCLGQPSICGSGEVGSVTPALAIPDNDATGASSSLTIGGPCTVGAIAVDVEFAHPYLADLVVVLQAPDGTSVMLHEHGSDAGLTGRYPDTLSSVEPLTTFVGATATGDWSLSVADLAATDVGTLVGWGLEIICI